MRETSEWLRETKLFLSHNNYSHRGHTPILSVKAFTSFPYFPPKRVNNNIINNNNNVSE